MILSNLRVCLVSLFVILVLVVPGFAQIPGGEGTPAQRLDILRQKLENVKRSLKGSISVLKKDKQNKNDKKNPETPLGRMTALQKETSSVLIEVNGLRGKVGRSDKFEISDIERLEETVAGLQSRVDKVRCAAGGGS